MSVSTATVREIVRKKLGWLKPKNIRKKFDEEEDRKLGKSIQDHQVHPVACLPDGTIVDGERRWRGAKLVGMEDIEVIIIEEELSESELRFLQAATVFHRKDWTPGEKYDFVYEVVQRNPTWQAQQVAEHLHVDPATLSKLLSFGKTIPAVREALEAGLLSIEDGHAFSRLSEAAQAELLPARLSGEIASREALKREVKARKSNGQKVTVPRMKAVLPSGAAITIARDGLDISGVVNAASELVKLAKKAEREGWDVKTFEAVLKDQAK